METGKYEIIYTMILFHIDFPTIMINQTDNKSNRKNPFKLKTNKGYYNVLLNKHKFKITSNDDFSPVGTCLISQHTLGWLKQSKILYLSVPNDHQITNAEKKNWVQEF